jgi:hypothetical protein
MFGREVRLREAMKRVLSALWWRAGPSGGASAHDVIVGLEAGECGLPGLGERVRVERLIGWMLNGGVGYISFPSAPN